MKKVFLALAAVVALAACSKEETLVQQAPEAIGFDTFVDNATRSVVDPTLTAGELEELDNGFSVYGFVTSDDNADVWAPIFTDEQVKFTGGAWGYTNTQYWIEDVTYDFCAIAPYHAGWDTVTATKSGASLSFTSDGETDLLYAQNNGVQKPAGNDKSVHFTFRHTLSKVKFSFLNNYDAANTTIKVHDIKVTNPYKSASVALNATTATWSDWAFAAQGEQYVLDFGNATFDNATTGDAVAFGANATLESYKELLLIPADYRETNKELAVEFTYDIVVNETPIKSIKVEPKVAVNLEPGHAYDFKATISHGERIEFTVDEVAGWDESNLNQTM